MRAHAAAPALCLVLLAGTAAGAWTQQGGDAEHSGGIDAGPGWGDVAFHVRLPGIPSRNPVIAEGAAWVTTSSGATLGVGEQVGVWRIDLATAAVTRTLVLGPDSTPRLVGDLVLDEQLDGRIDAYEWATGAKRWTARAPLPPGFVFDVAGSPAIKGDLLLIPYNAVSPSQAAAATEAALVNLVALDATSGAVLWQAPGETQRANLTASSAGPAATSTNGEIALLYARVAQRAPPLGPTQVTYRLLAFRADTGAFLWERADPLPPSANLTAIGQPALAAVRSNTGGAPVFTDTAVFLRTDRFLAINPATGATIWESSAGLADPEPVRGSLGAASAHSHLVAVSSQTIYALDPTTGEPRWQATTTRPGRGQSAQPIGLTATTAFVPYAVNDGEGPGIDGFEAWDLATGELLWSWERRHDVGPSSTRLSSPGYGEGVIVRGSWDGSVIILGRTPASLHAPPLPEALYPEAGERVRVDLSGARDGAFGPATRWRADWGDGNVTDWQASPVFEHAYDREAPVTARFTVGNDANQTTTVAVAMRVGEPAPNVLSEAFAPENQERTFFLLGAVLSGGGALAGVVALRRKRDRLRREIAAVDRLVADVRTDAAAREGALRDRRVRARALVVDGKLDEAQAAILERHIADLERRLRLSEVDEGLDFLPQGIARRVREALEDGRISTLERDMLVRLVDEDRVLLAEQKAHVKSLVERWWAGDGAGRGGGG